jgi:monofunctional biosynthetic peptidoglycan transglycosylase
VAAKRASRSIWKQIGRGVAILAVVGFAYVAYIYLTLPDVRGLAKTNPTTTAFMRLREEEARDEGRKFAIRHQWIAYGRVSPYLRRAVIVTEDAAFFDHDGIDMTEIKASLEKNWEEGQFLRGGSTLTQQLAKNLYLSPSRNPMRKVTELMIARRLETALTKQRIFEIYLNVIEWGDGIFGCEAASRAYFRKSCSALGMEEAALMAGSIINPRVHSPAKPTRRLLRRQQIILRRMGFKEPARPEPAPVNQTPIDTPVIPVPYPFPRPPADSEAPSQPPHAPSNKSGNGSPQIPPPPKPPAGFGATGSLN